MQVTWAALMREVMGNVWQQGIVVSCRFVTLGPVPSMSQRCSPAVCGGVHSFSLSQGPAGSWILFSVSPWWKSQSILLVLSECACAISVTEQEQHPQAAIVSALAYFTPVAWGSCSASPAVTSVLLEDGKCLFEWYFPTPLVFGESWLWGGICES